tara:strand:+ start:639 stop:812 length:174 start_codon:yes stop_codon:yes gene_type:complete
MERCNICDNKAKTEDLNLKFHHYDIHYCIECMEIITDLVVCRNLDLVKEKIKEIENE